MQVQIKVQSDELNSVLTAIRQAGIRNVNLNQVEDMIELTMDLVGDVAQVLRAVESTKVKPTSGYERLSQFASARPRLPDGSFAPMHGKRPASGTMKKTG